MKKRTIAKLIGATSVLVLGVVGTVCAIKRVKDIKYVDADLEDDNEDYDGGDIEEDELEEEYMEFQDDFPSDEEEEEELTEDDIFEGEDSETDSMEDLTEEEKFERICGLTPSEVKSLLSIKYKAEEIENLSLSELSDLYAQNC